MHPMRTTAMAGLVAAVLLTTPFMGVASAATVGTGGGSYTIGTPTLDQVSGAPWLTSQGDPSVGAPYANSLPTYTPPAAGTPNLALYPQGANNASGVAGTPGPLDGYCGAGGPNPESGAINAETTQTSGDLPMAPYYFPFVTRLNATTLIGYFDYRPKDTDEAVSVATSTDNGLTWTTTGEALDQNQGWCANGDSNDNGQGHAFVMTAPNGTTNLYTLSRPTGDFLGVNMLIHPVDTSDPTNPLDKLPASQPVGVDPDQTAAAGATVNGTAVTVALNSIGVGPEQLVVGSFVDLSTDSAAFACTGVSGNALTGCTSSGSVAITSGDTIEQVIATVTTGASIPKATTTASTAALAFGNFPSASIQTFLGNNASPGGRFFIDGNPVYCVAGSTINSWTQCSTPNATFTASAGDAVLTDPVVPVGVTQASGLVSPDGMVGIVPDYPGTPAGDVAVMYGEKIDSYYAPLTTTASVTLSATAFTIPVTAIALSPNTITTPGTFTLGVGSTFATVSCTGQDASDLTGCTTGTTGSVASGSLVGTPGACVTSSATLAEIGEGSTKSKTLFKNNEDYTVLRVAFTHDGVNFTDAGIVDGAQDLNNPAQTNSPSPTTPLDLAPGATDSPGLRFVGSRGTIITNSDGSLGLFMSGAWCTDGDSDSFNHIFYSQSTNSGQSWTAPQVVVSTDYTFSAREQQDASATPIPLNVTGYYSGRAYGPSVVQNTDGSLTMVFAGYSSPKPLPTVATLGNGVGGAPVWTLSAKDAALYRDILTVTLEPTAGTQVPESPFNVALPVTALALLAAGGWWLTRRRRTLRPVR